MVKNWPFWNLGHRSLNSTFFEKGSFAPIYTIVTHRHTHAMDAMEAQSKVELNRRPPTQYDCVQRVYDSYISC